MTEKRPFSERPAARPIQKPSIPSVKKTLVSSHQMKFKWSSGLGCLAIVAILLAVIGVVSFISSANPSPMSQEEIAATAETHCQNLVKKALKSPSTAQFSGESVAGTDSMTITGSVDSDNSFGATIRASFQCTATLSGDSVNVTLDSLN